MTVNCPYFQIRLTLPGFHIYIGGMDYDNVYGMNLGLGSWHRAFVWWTRPSPSKGNA